MAEDITEYELLTESFVSTADFEGHELLKIDPAGLTYLSETAMREIAFKLRTEHLEQVASILEDPESTENDRTIALTLLRNAEVSVHGVLPFVRIRAPRSF